MAEAKAKLYTLTQVANITKISMPTLQRYKKTYQDRIPSEGSGRSQRYPEAALKVFEDLKQENVSRRGRPRKTAAARKAAPAKKASAPRAAAAAPAKRKPGRPKKVAAQDGEMLTLTEVGNRTNISYPTLLRYVAKHIKSIPHKGTGRARRYHPEAVEVFSKLRQESKTGRKAGSTKAKAAAPKTAKKPGRKPGPKPKAAAADAPRRGPGRPPKPKNDAELIAKVRELEKGQKALAREVARLTKQLAKPFKVTLSHK